MSRTRNSQGIRTGFTLIELLVVIAIIGTLAALGAGAYFRVMSSQTLKRSEATIKKIHTGLASQWTAAIDDVNNEVKNAKMTGTGDTAKITYMTDRLTKEFPMTISEGVAKYPTLASAGSPPPDIANAICLYLALSKTRRGAIFNADDVGPSSTKEYGSFKYFVDAWGSPIKLVRWVTNPTTLTDLTQQPFLLSAGPDKVFGTNDDIRGDFMLKEGQRGN